jgi:site-specific recombinase XerC
VNTFIQDVIAVVEAEKLQGITLVVHSFHGYVVSGVIRTVQERLSLVDVATTVIYTHVVKVGSGAVRSPMDSMLA